MSDDYPDNGYNQFEIAGEITSLGEAVNRLQGGGGGLSRTGRMVWATGFEGSLNNTDFEKNTLASITQGNNGVIAESAWQGNNYLAFKTAAANGSQAYMQKYFPGTLQTGRWGIEAMVLMSTNNADLDIMFERISDQPGTYDGIIRLSLDNGYNLTIKYKDSTGTFQVLKAYNSFIPDVWYYAKLVVDTKNHNYVRFIWNNDIYDFTVAPLSNNASMFPTGLVNSGERSFFRYIYTTNAAFGALSGLDNVILTADEP